LQPPRAARLTCADSVASLAGAQALFMLFMTMPTIAETIAPDTPPPTS
jgi:hypothetical protein